MDIYQTTEAETETIAATCAQALSIPGAVLLIPTETVYGLVCDWRDEVARNRIYELKQRDFGKPLAMFASDRAMLEAAGVNFNETAEKIFEAFCPGPITMIVDGAENQTIGFRIPDHPLVLEILKQYGKPLASTSANRSGEPNALSVSEALGMLDGYPEVVVDEGAISAQAQASTVIQIKETCWNILRPGPVTEAQILAVIKA
jgi:L-threonylcarbamoyladenylate synthase